MAVERCAEAWRRSDIVRLTRISAKLGERTNARLVTMLRGDSKRTSRTMATALRQLPQQKRPSDSVVPGLLDGLANVNILTRRALDRQPSPALARKRA